MKAYSGRPIERSYGHVVFDVEKMAMPQKLPILLNHDPEKVVGYADSREVTHEGVFLSGVLCSTPDGERVAKLGDEGFPLTASIGLETEGDQIESVDRDETCVVNGQTLKGPIKVWRGSHLFETSFVTAGPADRSTSAVVLSDEERDVSKETEKLVAEAEAKGQAATREALKQFEDAFPNRPGYGARAFLEGKTLEQAKLEEKVLAADERAKAAEEKLKDAEERAKKVPTPQDRHPGLGFSGAEREGGSQVEDLSHLPPDERAKAEWQRDPVIRECFSSEKALAAFYRVEARGIQNKHLINAAAESLVRASLGE